MGTENYVQLLFPELYIHPKRGRNIVKKNYCTVKHKKVLIWKPAWNST